MTSSCCLANDEISNNSRTSSGLVNLQVSKITIAIVISYHIILIIVIIALDSCLSGFGLHVD